MADPTTNLRVRISADLADIKQGLGLLRGELAKVKAQGAAALPDNNAFVNGIRRARQELIGFVGAYLSLRGARVLGGIADEATLIRGRIKEAKGDYAAILALAQRTRTGLQSTVDLYTRVERSTRGQIANQATLLQLTESVNQAIKLSYGGTAQGEAAVLQLGQALGSGKLAGDELRSLSENAPRLVQAIADGMGKARGELKALGAQGKLTSDVVIKALLSQAKVLKDEYSRVPVTIGDAFTQIRNALVDYVGRQDAATGASRRFAQQLQEIARDLPRYLDPLLKALSFLIEHIDTLAVYLGTRLALGAIVAAVSGFLKLKAAIEAARVATITLRTALALIGGPVGIAIAALAAGIYYLATREDEATKAAKEHQKAMDEVRATAALSREEAIKLAQKRREEAIAALQAAQANVKLAQSQAEVARHQREALPLGGESGGAAVALSRREGAGQRAVERVKQLQQQLDDITKLMLQLGQEGVQEQLAKLDAAAAAGGDAGEEKLRGIADASKLAIDAVQRQLAELDRLYEKSQVSIADYYQRKQALQLADIDAQLVQARAEAASAKSNDQQAAALAKVVQLQRDRAEIAPRAAREQAEAEEELTRKLGEVHLRLLEADGKTAQARTGQLEEEFRDLILRLQREGDTAGVALVRKLINVEAADAQLQQFEAKMQQVMGRLQGREGTVAAQTSAGLLNPAEGERQLADARARSLQQLQALRAEAAAYLATLSPESPEAARALEFLDTLDTSLAQVAASQRTFMQQASEVGIDSLSTFFTDLTTGAKSFKEAFKDLVRNFVTGMAQIAARALATYLVLQLLDAIYPGLGRATAATMGAGVHHTGGIAGQAPATRRNLNPLLFGAAPRYHGGGIAGLAPDEVPAVLRKGEEILTEDNPRHRNNAGQRSRVTTPIVAFGDRAIADALAGTAGEDVVITHVMNNRDKLRRALA
jgi:tape measure domain-containing protein